jgi:hypothetical protein
MSAPILTEKAPQKYKVFCPDSKTLEPVQTIEFDIAGVPKYAWVAPRNPDEADQAKSVWNSSMLRFELQDEGAATLLVFSGFVDRVGAELYEGDITTHRRYAHRGLIEWSQGLGWTMRVTTPKGIRNYQIGSDEIDENNRGRLDARTRIGNIFTHPESWK